MSEASQILQSLAARIVEPYRSLPTLRAAMVTGSAAKGLSDYYSDLDFTFYYERDLPADEDLNDIRLGLGGSERKWMIGDPEEGSFAEAYDLHGIEVQIGHTTIAKWEETINGVLVDLKLDTPAQKALEGTLVCRPLVGEALIDRWKRRIASYPSALTEAMVKKHLAFFPIWGLQHHFETRDANLWGHQILVEAAYNIIGILAGLNRLYFTTFQFKRMHRFIEQMTITPDNLGQRLERLFHQPLSNSSLELEQLVSETISLVESHLPHIDTTQAKKRLGWRQKPWDPERLAAGK
ncbi:MAG: hypothetical protein QNJ45_04810 [Ardenticatenaceae bacterium]|nr:hypothetical protein [Ardenticatenaceae bacterium]